MAIGGIVSIDDIVGLIGGASIHPEDIAGIFPFIDKYIAVDGGADHLLKAKKVPEAVIGDLDSLSDHARATFADRLCHISDQSTTDFEKAIMHLRARAMIALGFTGGRMDHVLSVLNVLTRYPDRRVILTDAHDVSFLGGQGQTMLHMPPGTRLSVMPLDTARVSLRGVVWPFEDMQMHPGGFVSPSNAVADDPVRIDVQGPVLVTLPRAHLAAALKAVVPA